MYRVRLAEKTIPIRESANNAIVFILRLGSMTERLGIAIRKYTTSP